MIGSHAAWAVVLVAFSLGLDVFAVCVGVGIKGATPALKVRIGAAFATAEVTMTLIGAGLGALLGHAIGASAGYIGYAALVAIGIYMLVAAVRDQELALDLSRGWGLFTAALSISLDSLGIGFSILTIDAPLPVSLIAIALVSVGATATGLAFGRFLGSRAEEWAEIMAGVVLIATGVIFAAVRFFNL
jgi:putative Mn2+ efflux pump MntP